MPAWHSWVLFSNYHKAEIKVSSKLSFCLETQGKKSTFRLILVRIYILATEHCIEVPVSLPIVSWRLLSVPGASALLPCGPLHCQISNEPSDPSGAFRIFLCLQALDPDIRAYVIRVDPGLIISLF